MLLLTYSVILFLIILVGQVSSNFAVGTHEKGENWIYDSNGIPFYIYGEVGPQRNPLFIATEVIQHSQKNTTHDKNVALNNANWLINNSVSTGNYSIFEYNFSRKVYSLEPTWVSSMTQARAMRAMGLADNISNESKFLDNAKQFMNAFYVEAKDGGVTYKTPNDGWWYEEYASRDGLHPRILNGMMATLRDLHAYYIDTGDEEANLLFNKGMLALRSNIGDYDNKGHSYYDALGKLAGEKYHKYHVTLLSKLIKITGDELLKIYHDKWESFKVPFAKNKPAITS